MASRTRTKVIDLSKPYATDLAPQERTISHLAAAQNVIHEVSGAVHKAGGGTRLNSSALSGGPSVLGQFDYWKAGTSGSFTQVYVVTTSDGKVYCEENPSGAAGTFTDRTGAATIGANAIPDFAQAKDVLTMFWSDGSTPLQYNNTGAVSTLTNAPAGRCACWHKGRLWTIGTNAFPSRLYYSAYGTITTWTGEDTGAIDIDSEDGDRGIGLESHKGSLIVFKGPNKGSIHVVSGSAPEGEDGFTRELLVKDIPLQTPNSIVPIGDDFWFMSDRAIHSMSATARFGNFEEEFLTKYLAGEFRDNINRTRLASVWGVNYPSKGVIFYAMSAAGASTNTRILGISYIRPEDGLKPFIWTMATAQSLGIRINPSTKLRELIVGDNAGFLLRMDQSSRIMPSTTAYTGRVTTPSIVMGDADSVGQPRVDQVVTLDRAWLRSQAVGNYNVTLSVTRDTESPETYTFNQGASGFVLDVGVLDVAALGGTSLMVSAVDLVGECRSATFDLSQSGASEDMNLYELGIEYTPAGANQGASLT
jgi:hypothetical protein